MAEFKKQTYAKAGNDRRKPIQMGEAPYENLLNVQDGEVAIFVGIKSNVKVLPGDRILVRGSTPGNFRPIVVVSDITLLHHGNLPEPLAASFEQLIARKTPKFRLSTVHQFFRRVRHEGHVLKERGVVLASYRRLRRQSWKHFLLPCTVCLQ